MSDCRIEVDPGVCKMRTVIIAKQTDDMMGVEFQIESDCPHVRKYASTLGTVNPFELMGEPFADVPAVKKASGVIAHAACPVPCAVIKATEVAAGLGLKRDVHFTITDA